MPRGRDQYPQATVLGGGIRDDIFRQQHLMPGPSVHNIPSQVPPSRALPSQQSRARPSTPSRFQQMQSVPLLARRGAVLAVAPPNPNISAVHQAQLVRSGPEGDEATDLLQYLLTFAIRPQLLEPEECSFVWQFSISPETYQKRPCCNTHGDGSATQLLSNCVCLFSLRCLSLSDPSALENVTYWAGMDCKWPNAVYIHVNGQECLSVEHSTMGRTSQWISQVTSRREPTRSP
jgi:hypothetical protein